MKSTKTSAKREVQKERSAQRKDRALRSATIKSRAPGALKLASDENVPAKRAYFFKHNY